MKKLKKMYFKFISFKFLFQVKSALFNLDRNLRFSDKIKRMCFIFIFKNSYFKLDLL